MSQSKKPEIVADAPALDWPSTERGKPHKSAIPNVLFWLKRRSIIPHYNEFSQRVILKFWPPEQSKGDGKKKKKETPKEEQFADQHIHAIMAEMHSADCFITAGAVHTGIMHLAHQNAYHPVRDYIDALEWDGTPRLDKMLSRYIGAEDTDLNRAFSSAWMTAAVRRIREPGSKFDFMLVLRSAQGGGKSSFFNILAGDDWFNDSTDIGATSKEVIENLAGAWIVECAELANMNRADLEQIKRAITTRTDRARTAYARTSSEVPRQFILAGTINKTTFLRDDTGNRRFWIVEAVKLNEDALRSDRDQLWAEAAAREAKLPKGRMINIPQELWPKAEENNEAYEVPDAISERTCEMLSALPAGSVVVASSLFNALGIIDIAKRGGVTAQSVVAGARRAKWKPDKGAIPHLGITSGVRYYSGPVDKATKRSLYKYGDNPRRPLIRVTEAEIARDRM